MYVRRAATEKASKEEETSKANNQNHFFNMPLPTRSQPCFYSGSNAGQLLLISRSSECPLSSELPGAKQSDDPTGPSDIWGVWWLCGSRWRRLGKGQRQRASGPACHWCSCLRCVYVHEWVEWGTRDAWMARAAAHAPLRLASPIREHVRSRTPSPLTNNIYTCTGRKRKNEAHGYRQQQQRRRQHQPEEAEGQYKHHTKHLFLCHSGSPRPTCSPALLP